MSSAEVSLSESEMSEDSNNTFTDWLHTSIIYLTPPNDAKIQALRGIVEKWSELVVPLEWKLKPDSDSTNRPKVDKPGAAAFREAVISAASPASFTDDTDSRAILGSFHTLLALQKASVRQKGAVDSDTTEATFKLHMDALVADVFDHQYEIDGQLEFGNRLSLRLEETIWLRENPVISSKAHPDALITHGPIDASAIFYKLRETLRARESTTIPPSQLPLSPPPPMPSSPDADPTSTAANLLVTPTNWNAPAPPLSTLNKHLSNLYSNVHFQFDVSIDDRSLHLIRLVLEYENPLKEHPYHRLCMDFSTAQLQRRALLLDEQVLFGLALDEDADGLSVYASFWSKTHSFLHVSMKPLTTFSFQDDNAPVEIVRFFLFLRRLAKTMSPLWEKDEERVRLAAEHIAWELVEGRAVWRTVPGDIMSLTTENLSRFEECEGFIGQCAIEHWVAYTSECAMDGDSSQCMMEDSDQEEPHMDDEASSSCPQGC